MVIKKSKERRRRLKKPLILTTIGVVFLFLPVFNVIFNSIYYSIPLNESLLTFSTFGIILLLLSPIIGVGILQVQKWGWYAFVMYNFLVIGFNFYTILNRGNIYTYSIFFQSISFFIVIGYFLLRDISAPYFSLIQRGFRSEKRKELQIDVKIDGNIYKTKNISNLGLLVEWPYCTKNPGDEIEIEILGNTTDLNSTSRKAGIVRLIDIDVGIAFRK